MHSLALRAGIPRAGRPATQARSASERILGLDSLRPQLALARGRRVARARDAFPGVAGGVLGVLPREPGAGLGRVPVARQVRLGLVPGLARVARARLPAVL